MSVEIQRVIDGGTIDVITLDAAISSGLSFPATPTEHPIEDGSIISDHIRNDPETITVTGFVTNTPVTILGFGADDSLARGALDSLLEIRDKKELVQVTSDIHVFRDMAMTALEVPRDAPNANAMTFTATFKRITKVATEVTQFPEEDTEKRTVAPAELGKQTPVETEESTETLALQLGRGALRVVGVRVE